MTRPGPGRFVAQFPGVCSRCDEPIVPGQVCEHTGPTNADEIERRSLVGHVDCPDPLPTPVDLAPGETVCPSCWLVHAGSCR